MEQYNVTGMSCAACSARVEKAVKKVPGVTSCSVSLLTNSMGVEGTASPAAILSAVQEAGYGASPKNASASKASDASADLHQNIGAVDVLVQHRADAAHLALDAAQPVGEGAVLLRGTVLVAAAGGSSVLFGRLGGAAGLFFSISHSR